MESWLAIWCLVFLVLVSGNHFDLCFGCAEIDRKALLQVKASIIPRILASWGWEEDGRSDCCNWGGVVCSSINGRVEGLDLSDIKERIVSADASSWEEYKRNMNASVFAAFGELRRLDLSINDIIGWQKNEGFERLSGLKKLEFLDLSYNRLSASILPSLSKLSSLRTVKLAHNSLEASAYSIEALSSLKKLEVLDLSSNGLAGAIPPSLASLPSLKALSLSLNKLNGPVQDLCRLQKLQELDLSENELSGGLPQCLGNLTSLRILSLSHNRFEGAFSLHWFANHSELKIIDLTCDIGSKLEVQTEHPTWVPSFQLEAMYVSSCNLNRGYQGAIPSFLSTQYALKEIDMSHNRLSGSFPSWLLKNKTRLEALILRNNSMAGPFDPPHHLNMSIRFLDISNNHIDGYLPTDIGLLFPTLVFLNMSRNALQGNIPLSWGDVMGLASLDLSINNLTGEIPGNLTSIQMLSLSNNNLHGTIFLSYGKFGLGFFRILLLANNQFTEINVSDGLSIRWIHILDIGNNKLSGMLPSWMGETSNFNTLILKGNNFHGPIPISFCQLDEMNILDISHNNLFGPMPSCFNLPQLRHLHLQRNELTGSISNGLLRSPKLVTLDIRYNRLHGSLPSWIWALSELRALLLSGNHFHGPIPLDYCQLNLLNILDLSYNNLSGSIPSCFSNMFFGTKVADTAFLIDSRGITVASSSGVDNLLSIYTNLNYYSFVMDEQQAVEFILKSRLDTYKGVVLNLIAGIDLSCNHLTGDIPTNIGNLSKLFGLNLSHNHLTGPIPKSFSKLKSLESLDLSHNQLRDSIPSQLTQLTSLAVFTVAYNNFSGRLPSFTAQFGTFNESTYEGNPYLCGPPLKKSCTSSTPTHELFPKTSILVEEDDLILKLTTFGASYMVFLSGFVIPLYLNKNWRGRYFHAMDTYLLLPIKNCFLDVYVWIYIKVRRAWM